MSFLGSATFRFSVNRAMSSEDFKWGNCHNLSATLRMGCTGVRTGVKTKSLMKLSISKLLVAAQAITMVVKVVLSKHPQEPSLTAGSETGV